MHVQWRVAAPVGLRFPYGSVVALVSDLQDIQACITDTFCEPMGFSSASCASAVDLARKGVADLARYPFTSERGPSKYIGASNPTPIPSPSHQMKVRVSPLGVALEGPQLARRGGYEKLL